MTSYADAGLKITNNSVVIVDPLKLQSTGWDSLVYASVFGDRDTKIQTRWAIGEVARLSGIKPASINALYKARASGELKDDFTVPALNLKGMGYDSARAIFSVMVKNDIGAVIFEISKSETEYTGQSPEEYKTVVMAAAIREGYSGPIFLQADHVQLRAKSPGVAKDDEQTRLEHFIKSCIRADFYNIDIDASTLVDLSQKEVTDQQKANVDWTQKLAQYIREIEPVGLPISIGGEIGHIGDKNSTVEDFETFMVGLQDHDLSGELGISKVSVQTGTSHGGVVDKDGKLEKMTVDFGVLKSITEAGKKYGVGGSVQHGASTLPNSQFKHFPASNTLEIHLATGWQNILFDHPTFPKPLKAQIYDSILEQKKDTDSTDAQFLYRNRKRGWGPFKQEVWDMGDEVKSELRTAIAQEALIIFDALNANGTVDLVKKYALTHDQLHSIHDYQGD